jgi:hypothetical protein
MREARRARSAWRGGASRGDPRHKLGTQRFGPRVLWCTTTSSWVETRGTCRRTRHKGRTWLARRRAHGSEHDAMVAHTTLGCASSDTSSKVQQERGRNDGATHRGSTVESSPAWCREHATARKRFVASRSRLCFSLPRGGTPACPPRTLPAHRRRRSARPRLLLLPARAPPLLPPLPLAAANREGEKPQCGFGLREGLGPGGCRVRSRGQGHGHGARPGWLARRKLQRGSAAVGGVTALGMAEEGQRCLFPLGRPRGMHTGAPWLGVRASRRPNRPIARARSCGASGCGAVQCRAEGEK